MTTKRRRLPPIVHWAKVDTRSLNFSSRHADWSGFSHTIHRVNFREGHDNTVWLGGRRYDIDGDNGTFYFVSTTSTRYGFTRDLAVYDRNRHIVLSAVALTAWLEHRGLTARLAMGKQLEEMLDEA